MKINTTYNEFLNEKKNKKNSIKSKVKKIDKKIKKTVGKQEDLVKIAKELADSPEPSDKMKASLAKVQLRQSSAKAQELVMRKEAEILKNKIKTAKKKERATNEDMKHVKLFERFITDSDVTRWEREHGREDLIDKMDESLNESNYYPGFDGVKITGYVEGEKAKLNHIEVKAAQRGSGIGSKAVADFERWAKEQGAKYVEIDAYKKSIKFWEKMGYELEKEFPVMYGHKQDYKTGIKEL